MNKKIVYMVMFFILLLLIIYILSNKKEPKKNATFSLTNEFNASGEISDTNDFSGENINIDEEYNFDFIGNSSTNFQTVKAVYSSGWIAGGESSRKEMIQNINTYGFNAIVLDIKDEAGHLSYHSNVQTAIDVNASRNMIKDIKSVIEEYHDNDIYVIGRIVTFKDPTYAKVKKDISFQKVDGSYWTDKSGNYWPNPYNKESWNYPIALAREAAQLGFDEIQFDYVRFPSSEGSVKQISFGFDSESVSKSEIINQFLIKATNELADYKVKVSADVFGITTKRDGDFENIGQDYKAIANIVDVICPMVYPSHYGKGEYGVAKPDLDPYTIIYKAMIDAKARTSGDSITAITRPYLQDFTASWLGKGNYQVYDAEAVCAQIKACHDLGINSFTLWDPSNKYCYEAFELASKSGE
ncbi:MAG: putative glycoside hydrolase [Clostridia bacterium]|nr:putative glycoside hydrolase [Clostridia bacterium]